MTKVKFIKFFKFINFHYERLLCEIVIFIVIFIFLSRLFGNYIFLQNLVFVRPARRRTNNN